jgi:hypothetical protein
LLTKNWHDYWGQVITDEDRLGSYAEEWEKWSDVE